MMNILNRILPAALILCVHLQYATGSTQTELQNEANVWHSDRQQPTEGISLGESSNNTRAYAAAGRMCENGLSVDENSLYEIGSITKVFTGILLADTVLQGKASLNDSIAKHLPEDVISEDSPLQKVTLLELSTHTSGLPRIPEDLSAGAKPKEPYAHYSRDRMFHYLKAFTEDNFKKRGEYSYSNLGVGLLAEILAMINETEYEKLLAERILKPLHMDSTWVQTDELSEPSHLKDRFTTGHNGGDATPYWRLNAFSGAGAMVSSVSDLLTFAEAHWSDDTPSYLKDAFDLAMKHHSERVALGWHYDKESFSHGGATGGFSSMLTINPNEKYAKVSLRNSSGEKIEMERRGDFPTISGFWSGALDLGERKLRLVIHITEAGKADCYSIDQGGMPIPSSKSTFENNELVINYPSIGGIYKAAFKDGKLAGNWVQGSPLKLEMTHSDKMPESLQKIFNHIYDGDLEQLVGFWSGSLGNTSEGLYVYFEVSKIGDYYQASIWSPTQSPLPIAVSKVSYKDNQLEVGSNMIGGSFKGKFDPVSKKINGKWTQGEVSALSLTWSEERPENP